MTTMPRVIDTWSAQQWRWRVQHPALALAAVTLHGDYPRLLPHEAGCYVLVDPALQRTYPGTAQDLAARIPDSRRRNLPRARLVLTVVSGCVPWDDAQRHDVERRLIAAAPGVVNRSHGRRPTAGPGHYAELVVAEVLATLAMLVPLHGERAEAVRSQGQLARELVLAEHRHPMTVGQLCEELRRRGWPVSGATVHRTLRRDLCDAGRGGTDRIRTAGGRWSDAHALVYVRGRAYTSGWRAPEPLTADDAGA